MLNVERSYPSGAWKVSAFVYGNGITWLETRTFYGYTKRAAMVEYRAMLRESNLKISKL